MQLKPISVSGYVNGIFAGKEPWQISATTAFSVLLGLWIWDNIICEPESLYERGKKQLFRLIKKLPFVAGKISTETEKVYKLFEKEMAESTKNWEYTLEMPKRKKDVSEILRLVEQHFTIGKYNWQEGYVSGAVYYYNEELLDLVAQVCKLASYANPLHPDVFPGACKMEAEVIKMAVEIFHGGEDGCGVMTSGGTESIIMACKACRDYGKEKRGISHPEIVLPKSAHAAFDKAGSYLGIRLKHIDLDSDTMCVNIKSMKKAISRNTIMLVGSAPNFPYGTIDNIEEISKLGQKYNIPVHVDCCLGSFIAAFMPEAGYKVPHPFDFSLPGVTSMSVDTHKYGFAPKGSSLVLYSTTELRRYQYYTSLSWPGGHYGSASVSGSRSGAIIAACWATIMYFGKDGYIDATRKIVSVSRYIEEGLRKIPGIFIFGKPFSTVVAIGSNEFHIYRLSQALSDKKWNLNTLQFPLGLHICVTHLHTLPGVADKFLDDVREAVEEILKTPNASLSGKVAMYGMSATLPDRALVGDFTKYYIDALFYTPKKPITNNVK